LPISFSEEKNVLILNVLSFHVLIFPPLRFSAVAITAQPVRRSELFFCLRHVFGFDDGRITRDIDYDSVFLFHWFFGFGTTVGKCHFDFAFARNLSQACRSPAAPIVLEQIQKEEHAEHYYYKGPVFIELVQDMMQKFHYALHCTEIARPTDREMAGKLATTTAEAGTRLALEPVLSSL